MKSNMSSQIASQLTLADKINLASSSIIVSIILIIILISDFLVVLWYYLGNLYDQYFLSFMILSSTQVLALIFYIILMFRFKKSQNLKTLNTLSIMVFLFFILKIFIEFTLIIGLFYKKNEFLSFAKANSFYSNDLDELYNIFIAIKSVLFAFSVLFQSFLLYALINIGFSLKTHRTVLIILEIIAIFCSFCSFFCSKQANNYTISFKNSEDLIGQNLLKLIFLGLIVYTLILVLGILINFIRWRNVYQMHGAITLIFSLTFISMSSSLLRNSTNLNLMYKNNCPDILRLISQDFLIDSKCPYKYKTFDNNGTSLYDLNCEYTRIGVVWESISEKITNEHNLACLNYECCEVLSSSLTNAFIILGLSLFGNFLLGFSISAFSFFMSNVSNLENKYYLQSIDIFKKVHKPKKNIWKKFCTEIIGVILFIISTIIFLIGSSTFISQLQTTNFYYPSSQSASSYNKIAINESQNLQKSVNFLNILSGDSGNTSFCNNLTDALNQSVIDDLISINTTFSVSRIAMLCKECKLAINFNILTQMENLQLFSVGLETYKKTFYPSASSNSDFILFQGSQVSLSNFLKLSLKICTAPYANNQIYYMKYFKGGYSNQSSRILKLENHNKANIKHMSTSTFPSFYKDAGPLFDTYTWGNLKIIIYDSQTKLVINNVKASMISWKKTSCASTDSSEDISREGISNTTGEIFFFNVIKKTYTIVLSKNGYKTNCITVDFSSSNSSENVFVASMIQEFSDPFYVTLEWNRNNKSQENNISFQLQATYNLNNKDCYSSIFDSTCPELVLNETIIFDEKLVFQQMIATRLPDAKILFFVQRLPFSNHSCNSSEIIIDSFPTIKIYSSDLSHPLAQFFYPFYRNETNNLVWMAFCLKGNEITSQDKIWTVPENSTDLNNQEIFVPDSSYCS